MLLRRRKEDVAFDLPPKIELNELIPLSTFERDTYNQLRVQAKRIIQENPQQAKFLVLSLLTKLRQVCCHRKLVLESASNHSSKLDRALEIVQNLHQNKRKVLVFSQFVRLLQLFKEQLIESKWIFAIWMVQPPVSNDKPRLIDFKIQMYLFFLSPFKVEVAESISQKPPRSFT